MNASNELLAGLKAAMNMSSASLSFVSSSVSASVVINTTVSASVYKSYGFNLKYDVDQFEYNKVYEDFSVIAKTSDVGMWGLQPKISKVSVNGAPYMVGGVVTYTDYYQWISLRTFTSTA